MDLLTSPAPELLAYVERVQLSLSTGLDPRLSSSRTPEAREKDLDILRGVAGHANPISFLGDLDPRIQPSYAAVASPQAFEVQIDQLARMSTRHESILALHELIDLWNYVAGVVCPMADPGQYQRHDILLATSANLSLNARTVLSPDGDVQVILFYERLFSFVEHVSYLLPLAIRESSLDDDWQEAFPGTAAKEITPSFVQDDVFRQSVQLLLERYLEGESRIDRIWSHNLGSHRRLVAQDVASAMQFFVMGHELAHGLCGHEGSILGWTLEEEDAGNGSGSSGKLQLSEVERNWDQELEADYVG